MKIKIKTCVRTGFVAISLLALSGCLGDGLDRIGGASGPESTGYVPPEPDERGVITYQSYQVAVAMRDDTVRAMAGRFGQSVDEMASLNGIGADVPLRAGEVIVLPRGVGGAEVIDGRLVNNGQAIRRPGEVDIETIAADAIDAADPEVVGDEEPLRPTDEPLRHRVRPGETAASIGALYGVSESAISRWNGLGSGNSVRVGQSLLIPPPNAVAPPRLRPPERTVARPGQGSQLAKPPSASQPLPEDSSQVASAAPEPEPEPPAETGTKLTLPVNGTVLRDFQKGRSDGIDIAAAAGSPVVAAGDGTVAAITQDSDGVPILVIRHEGGLLTVYAGIDEISVKRGDAVRRGQQIAIIRDANPSFLHFETRRGFDAVDPAEFLN